MGRDALQYFRELREAHPELQAEYERLGPRFSLGWKIRQLRIKAKLTQAQLGERAGVSRSIITRLESLEHAPRLETVVDLGRALGYRLDVKLVRKTSRASDGDS